MSEVNGHQPNGNSAPQHITNGFHHPENNTNSNSDTPLATDNNTSNDNTNSVIIVGAGPVGVLLALRLAQSGIGSVLLEKELELSRAPRAIGYYGPVHNVFEEAGLYDRVAKEGMHSGGYVWRKLPEEYSEADGSKGKRLGPIIGRNIMSRPDENGQYQLGHYSIQLAQCRLTEIMLEDATKTGLVQVFWGQEVVGLTQDAEGVTVSTKNKQGEPKTFKGDYLAACDGGKSTVRKLLGIRLTGHSWPERFVATDVLRTAPVVADPPVHFTVDPRYWGVVTPLEHVEAGKRGLWRYSMAVPPRPGDDENDNRPALTDEEVLSPEYVDSLLLRQIDGPRPSDHEVVRKSLYKMHQLLASTMNRGRCFLAGDAAHINNPIGGLGLCTGLLDADALHQALVLAFEQRKKNTGADLDTLFRRYSAERRFVFQNVIHPFSSANKTRLHGGEPDNVAREDWYFQALARGDAKELKNIHKPLYEVWRTDMRALFPDLV